MSRYAGRHSARHASPRKPRAAAARWALSRPAVSSSLALAVVATTATGFTVADRRQTSNAASAVSTPTVSQPNEITDAHIETARLTSQREAAGASRAAVAEQQRLQQAAAAAKAAARKAAAATAAAEKAAAEKATEARAATAARAARDKTRKVLATQKKALVPPATSDPKGLAMALLPSYGWDSSQFGCLDNLWTKESGWLPSATNASSGAYGIPQSLPGSKMASAGADWQTNPATQIRW